MVARRCAVARVATPQGEVYGKGEAGSQRRVGWYELQVVVQPERRGTKEVRVDRLKRIFRGGQVDEAGSKTY